MRKVLHSIRNSRINEASSKRGSRRKLVGTSDIYVCVIEESMLCA